MDPMDKLYELYCLNFDRLAVDIRRLNEERPQLNFGPTLAACSTRQRFEHFLLNGRETETKRLLLKRILLGNEQLYAILPAPLRSLANRAA